MIRKFIAIVIREVYSELAGENRSTTQGRKEGVGKLEAD